MGPEIESTELSRSPLNPNRKFKRYFSLASNLVSPKSPETRNEQELICPETKCQMSLSTMKELCEHASREHNIALKEYNVTFPTLEEYHIWLSQFSNGNFSEPYAAQLQSNGTYVGVLYCSQMKKQRTLASYAFPPIKVANGSCISHIRYQLNCDKSVDVYAQENHCGHDILQKEVRSPMTVEGNEASFSSSKDSMRDSGEKSVPSSSINLSSGEIGLLRPSGKRYQVFMEMLETEENYMRILNLLEDLFKKPLEIKLSEGEELLSRKEIAMIFSKVPAIIQVHTKVYDGLCSLKNNWKESALVGKIWADRALDLVKVYPSYINNYDDALKTLETGQLKPKFVAFLKKVESKPECRKNSLRDMLIRPVQRIPSVLLLLQELLKRTKRGNNDIKCLKGAINQIKEMLEKTNESRRQSENFHRFFEVCNQIEDLPPNFITSERDFVQSLEVIVLDAGGVLNKFKNRVMAMFLFNDVFVFAKSRTANVDPSSSPMSKSILNTSLAPRQNTLSRQLSFAAFRRREKKPYRLISVPYFSDFRSLEVIKEHGLFIAKIRDEIADELLIFQVTNDCTTEMGIAFFATFIKLRCTDPLRDFALEELDESAIEMKYANQIEEWEMIKKALFAAEHLARSRAVDHPSQLRRAVSNVSLGIAGGIHRFTSRSMRF